MRPPRPPRQNPTKSGGSLTPSSPRRDPRNRVSHRAWSSELGASRIALCASRTHVLHVRSHALKHALLALLVSLPLFFFFCCPTRSINVDRRVRRPSECLSLTSFVDVFRRGVLPGMKWNRIDGGGGERGGNECVCAVQKGDMLIGTTLPCRVKGSIEGWGCRVW